ncbi:MAG: restriction endonuclease subunit S, partial [Bacillota bacterium]|nr:restriction endonuclease subunit S [Bacillota bacterium]
MVAQRRRLDEMAEIMMGINVYNKLNGKYKYSMFQPNSFSDVGKIEELTTIFSDIEVADHQVLRMNDIIMKRLNPSYVYIVCPKDLPAVASQNLLVIRPNENIDPTYLGYLLEQKEIVSQTEHISGSAAAIKAISAKKLGSIAIPLLKSEKQKKIGALWMLEKKRR